MSEHPGREEVEIKLPVDDVDAMRRRLAAAGARLERERTFEDNRLFDYPDRRLTRQGELLRLRRSGARWLLTHKGPPRRDGGPYKLRVETETAVADGDALEHVLTRLGLEPIYRYQKFRTEYAAGALALELDETPAGAFLELEGPTEAIDAWAARLGYAREDYVRDTYRDIHVRQLRKRGLPPRDMVFPETDAGAGA